jgi:hypothetical protein
MLDRLKSASQQRYISPFSIGVIYAGLGDTQQALTWLERAYELRDNWLVNLKVEPRLDALRQHPRFRNLLRLVGLT